MTHDLKIWPEHFQAIADGRKRFEVRNTKDRLFDGGDTIRLHEWIHEEARYTGRKITATLSMVHSGLGMADGFAALGLENVVIHDSVEGWANRPLMFLAKTEEEAQAIISKASVKGQAPAYDAIFCEAFADNGEHSHWNMVCRKTGTLLWTEDPDEEWNKNHRRPALPYAVGAA